MHQTGPGSERTFERENKNNKENEGSEQCAPDVKPSRKHAPTLADTGDGILDVSPLSGAGEGRADFGLVTPVRSDASEGCGAGAGVGYVAPIEWSPRSDLGPSAACPPRLRPNKSWRQPASPVPASITEDSA